MIYAKNMLRAIIAISRHGGHGQGPRGFASRLLDTLDTYGGTGATANAVASPSNYGGKKKNQANALRGFDSPRNDSKFATASPQATPKNSKANQNIKTPCPNSAKTAQPALTKTKNSNSAYTPPAPVIFAPTPHSNVGANGYPTPASTPSAPTNHGNGGGGRGKGSNVYSTPASTPSAPNNDSKVENGGYIKEGPATSTGSNGSKTTGTNGSGSKVNGDGHSSKNGSGNGNGNGNGNGSKGGAGNDKTPVQEGPATPLKPEKPNAYGDSGSPSSVEGKQSIGYSPNIVHTPSSYGSPAVAFPVKKELAPAKAQTPSSYGSPAISPAVQQSSNTNSYGMVPTPAKNSEKKV
uniref:Uncharacterized protein n=1 Tax=Globisporangium ultimum (strain ATCC 200006 / CBS 805.95 / DAOM BR144) TaxID=431595 RepID=K3X4S0_GLOUD